MRRLRIGLAQINTTVGYLDGNTRKIVEIMGEARSQGVDLLAFPELAICGYPPEDLLLKPQFLDDNLACLDRVVKASQGLAVVVGFVDVKQDIYNAAAVAYDGRLAGVYHKIFLPNYGVFDEMRYFQAGNEYPVFSIAGVGVGINICEDIWYEAGPATFQSWGGAEVIVNISASPYHYDKGRMRERLLSTRASDATAIVAFVNLVGGQDELVFDGNSMIADEQGRLLAAGKQFEEELIVVDLDVEAVFRTRLHDPRWRRGGQFLEQQGRKCAHIAVSGAPVATPKPHLSPRVLHMRGLPGEAYNALVVGTRDYVRKNDFQKVIIGLSGGIDSSIVAVVAADALGPADVLGVSMPSRYSSAGSVSDAQLLADNLGIKLLSISIEKVFQSYLDTLAGPFEGTAPGLAEENIQARIRGNFLMALSNKFGYLVLTTGNKSEMATGYSTLYGDMAGGFAVIKDVPKTMVYELARYRNSLDQRPIIPESVFQKPPSAELKPDQKDSDTLPPYSVLDPIMTAYVEEDKSIAQIIAMGFDEAVVRKAAALVDGSEYKRRQAPPGIKMTPRAFGRDRRLPITNRYRNSYHPGRV